LDFMVEHMVELWDWKKLRKSSLKFDSFLKSCPVKIF
jgi:hypothetical protein